jgi:hypothetical protein
LSPPVWIKVPSYWNGPAKPIQLSNQNMEVTSTLASKRLDQGAVKLELA